MLLTLLPLMLLRPCVETYGPDVKMLTTTQAARELGVSARSLARWAAVRRRA
jgi:hypothetical protein